MADLRLAQVSIVFSPAVLASITGITQEEKDSLINGSELVLPLVNGGHSVSNSKIEVETVPGMRNTVVKVKRPIRSFDIKCLDGREWPYLLIQEAIDVAITDPAIYTTFLMKDYWLRDSNADKSAGYTSRIGVIDNLKKDSIVGVRDGNTLSKGFSFRFTQQN